MEQITDMTGPAQEITAQVPKPKPLTPQAPTPTPQAASGGSATLRPPPAPSLPIAGLAPSSLVSSELPAQPPNGGLPMQPQNGGFPMPNVGAPSLPIASAIPPTGGATMQAGSTAAPSLPIASATPSVGGATMQTGASAAPSLPIATTSASAAPSTPPASSPYAMIGERPVYSDMFGGDKNGFYIPPGQGGPTVTSGVGNAQTTSTANPLSIAGAPAGPSAAYLASQTDNLGRPLDRSQWGKDTSYNYYGGDLVSQNLNGAGLTNPTGTPLSDPWTGTPLAQSAQSGTLPIATAANSAPGGSGMAPSSLPIAGVPDSGGALGPYANLSTTTPGGASDYTDKTIQPGSGVDRVKLAQDAFDSFAKSSDPYYQKALRDANAQAAATGGLGSGMLRTSLGDAANLRNLQLDSSRDALLNGAVNGSIEDQYRNIGLAQQQQGFQAGRQDTAFGQQMAQLQLEEALRTGDFSRALQMLGIGMAGNPSGTALQLADSYNNAASQAGAGAGNLIQNAIVGNANNANNNSGAPRPPAQGGGGYGDILSGLSPDALDAILGAGGGGVQQTPHSNNTLPIDPGYHGPIRQPSLPVAY